MELIEEALDGVSCLEDSDDDDDDRLVKRKFLVFCGEMKIKEREREREKVRLKITP